jgi:hypothetical protein
VIEGLHELYDSWGLTMKNQRWMLFIALTSLMLSQTTSLPAFAEEKDQSGQVGEVQERGVRGGPMPAAPPYSCGSGVCLCVGQDNCNQMTQPQPCKREKFCLGQTASPPQPLPPQEPALSQQKMQSTARTSSGSIVICSCRAGQ